MVAVDGGDELRSVAACEKQRRGGGARRVREGARGCVASWETSREGGGSQAGRRWPGRCRRSPRLASVLLVREEDDRGESGGGLGRAGPVGGAR